MNPRLPEGRRITRQEGRRAKLLMPPSFSTLLSAAARLHPAPSRLVPQLCLRSGGRFPQPESLLASLSSPIQTAAASRHPCLAPRSCQVCDVSTKPPWKAGWKAGAPQRSGAALGVLHRAGIVLILPLSLSVAAAPAALTAPCSPPFGAAPGVWQPQEQTRCGLEPAPAPSTACSVRVVPELQRSALLHSPNSPILPFSRCGVTGNNPLVVTFPPA